MFKNELIAPAGAEITAFSMDMNQRRFIIGDSRGQVKVFNYLTGELMKALSEHHDGEILNIMTVKTKEMPLIVTIGSNNVIQLHEDDKINGPSAVRRAISIPNYEIHVGKVYIYEGEFGRPKVINERMDIGVKYLIVGLNKGQIKTYELETGRPDGSYSAYQETSDILEILPLTKKPFFFTTENHGYLTLWVAPPCLNKYQKCFE